MTLQLTKNYLQSRLDAIEQKLKCSSRSYQCGKICIPRRKKCRLSEAQLTEIVHAVEDKIKDLPYERVVAINPKNGQLFFTKTGDQTSIYFTDEEARNLKGSIVTHNHPNLGWGKDDERSKGLSFSYEDVSFAAVVEVAEIRAVGSKYRHSLKPPKQGWNADFFKKKLEPTYGKYVKEVYNESYWNIFWGKKRRDVAEAEFHHEVIKRTSEELGMKYSRTKI